MSKSSGFSVKTNHLNSNGILDIILIILFSVAALIALPIFIIPIGYVLISSVSTSGLREMWGISLKSVTLEGYKALFKDSTIWRSFCNSVRYTAVGWMISLSLTVLCAYPLSRRNFFLGKYVELFLIFTLYFSGGMIPTYLLVKNLGLLNTMWALILPSCISVYNCMLMSAYFRKNISEDLFEAACMDGCGHWRFLIKIVVPMSEPVLAVISLFYIISYWNSYFDAMIYITDQSKLPLANVLRNILILNQSLSTQTTAIAALSDISLVERANLIQYALIVVISLPIVILAMVINHFSGNDKGNII